MVPEFRPARKGHPGIQVRTMDALAERLAARGHEVVWDDDLPGRRRFHASDRLGDRLEFLEPLPAAADA